LHFFSLLPHTIFRRGCLLPLFLFLCLVFVTHVDVQKCALQTLRLDQCGLMLASLSSRAFTRCGRFRWAHFGDDIGTCLTCSPSPRHLSPARVLVAPRTTDCITAHRSRRIRMYVPLVRRPHPHLYLPRSLSLAGPRPFRTCPESAFRPKPLFVAPRPTQARSSHHRGVE
jgi:hypothetical protein